MEKPIKIDIVFILFFISIYFHFFPSPVWANEEKSLLKRASQTETVFLQEKGEIQMTTALDFSSKRKENLLVIPFAIEYGISDVWETELEWEPFVFKDPDHGLSTKGVGDLKIGTKYSFLNIGGPNFHVAPGLKISFPTGSLKKDLTDGFIKYEPSLVLALDLPRLNHSQFFTEIGISFLDRVKEPADPEDRKLKAHELIWDIGFIIPIKNALIIFEFNWETNAWNNNGKDNETYISSGLDWEFMDDLELNLGLQIGLTNDAEDYKLNGKVTYEFDLFEKDKESEDKNE